MANGIPPAAGGEEIRSLFHSNLEWLRFRPYWIDQAMGFRDEIVPYWEKSAGILSAFRVFLMLSGAVSAGINPLIFQPGLKEQS
jgi:hypothetical protein